MHDRTGKGMSEATRRIARLAPGNLCKILSPVVTGGRISKSIFEWKEGVSQDAILQDEAKMNEINKKWEKFKMGSCAKSTRIDWSKGKLICSEESSRAIFEMGNIEFIELKQTSPTVNVPLA